MTKKKTKKKKIKNSKLKELLSKLKGFTLVELLAVIVILAIIMVIAIPSVVNTSNTANKKSFVEFVRKVSQEVEKKYLEATTYDGLEIDTESEVAFVVYTVENDLGLKNVGDYKGVAMVGDSKDVHYNRIAVFNKKYFVDNSFAGEDPKELSLDDISSRTTIDKQLQAMSGNSNIKLENLNLKKVYAYVQARMNCGDSRITVYDGATNNEIVSYLITDTEEIKKCYNLNENRANTYMGEAMAYALNGTLDSHLVSN